MENSQPAMFRSLAEVLGCLAAPIPVVGVGIVESIFYTSFDVVAIIIFSLVAYACALGFTLVLGYPLYRLLVRIKAMYWWTSVLSGFAIGVLATFLTAHPMSLLSGGVLVNASAAAASGLLFWAIQQGHWGEKHSAGL